MASARYLLHYIVVSASTYAFAKDALSYASAFVHGAIVALVTMAYGVAAADVFPDHLSLAGVLLIFAGVHASSVLGAQGALPGALRTVHKERQSLSPPVGPWPTSTWWS